LDFYREVLKRNSSSKRLQEEVNSIEASLRIFYSTGHIFSIYHLCRKWNSKKHLVQYRKIAEKEISNCEKMLNLVRRDKRIGFHPEAQVYMFDEKSLLKKLSEIKVHIE
jgi:hypothetical protein